MDVTTAHPWCDGHSTSISACGVWGVRAGVQVTRRELHTYIHLNWVRVEFLSCKKKKKKKKGKVDFTSPPIRFVTKNCPCEKGFLKQNRT